MTNLDAIAVLAEDLAAVGEAPRPAGPGAVGRYVSALVRAAATSGFSVMWTAMSGAMFAFGATTFPDFLMFQLITGCFALGGFAVLVWSLVVDPVLPFVIHRFGRAVTGSVVATYPGRWVVNYEVDGAVGQVFVQEPVTAAVRARLDRGAIVVISLNTAPGLARVYAPPP